MCRGPTMSGAGFTGSSTGTIFQPSRTRGGNTASAAGPRRSITSMGATSLLRTASRSFPQRRTVRTTCRQTASTSVATARTLAGSLLLPIQGRFDTQRDLLVRHLRPEMTEHDARLLGRHVAVD